MSKPQTKPKSKVLTKAVAPVAEKLRKMLPHELLTSPSVQSAIGIQTWGKFVGEIEMEPLVTELRDEIRTIVQDGNMKPAEAMLYGQAITLQTIFTNLSMRAALNAGEYMDATDKYLRLALKAQSQCRATLETLAAIKNPSIVYAKQANFANGHQQVNNGISSHQELGDTVSPDAPSYAQAEIIENLPNKLLEENYERLDIGAQAAAGRANQDLEAVGAVHRTKVTRW